MRGAAVAELGVPALSSSIVAPSLGAVVLVLSITATLLGTTAGAHPPVAVRAGLKHEAARPPASAASAEAFLRADDTACGEAADHASPQVRAARRTTGVE